MTVDTVVIKTPENIEAPEGHDEKMIAKVDAVNAPAEETRPDWLPTKFKSVEDMAKAYSELESKLGTSKPATEEVPEVTPEVKEPATEEVKAELESKGLSLSDFSKEFNDTGALSDDSYSALEKAGYDRTLVDGYIAGQKAIANEHFNSVVSVVGGAEAYTGMVSWAKDNLPAQDILAYNQAVESGDLARTRLAVSGLQARFTAENGSEPSLVGGRGQVTAGGEVFESVAQVTAAMKDPRYKTDQAFRNKVQAQLGRSEVF